MTSIPQKLRLPSVCVVCQQYHRNSCAVCQICLGLFSRLTQACRYCAFPLPDDNFPICGTCSKIKPHFDAAFIAYRFEEPLRTLLHDYKYNSALFLRKVLAKLMLDALPDSGLNSECLIPVPLHSQRLKDRGFNQSAELCKLLSRHTGIPYHLNLCRKIRPTEAQMTLNIRKRQKNLTNAFAVEARNYKHITLVDDLLTTGNTVQQISKLFKEQGVEHIDVWCCARAVKD
ncbi:ComF family protein [Legionella jordanis]|nr:ComF family protein [Legionella jordanis]